MQKKSFPWGVIVLMFCLFFPVGIGMLIKKMTSEKLNRINNGKSLKIFGWVFIGLGLIYFLLGITGQLRLEDGSSAMGIILIMVIICVAGGLFTLYKASSYIKLGTKYNRYIFIINASGNVSISSIAAAYPTSFEEAAEDLQAMINDGYFINTYIDWDRQELVSLYAPAPAPPMANGPQQVICRNCGALNQYIPGMANVCGRCGSPL